MWRIKIKKPTELYFGGGAGLSRIAENEWKHHASARRINGNPNAIISLKYFQRRFDESKVGFTRQRKAVNQSFGYRDCV